MYVAGKNPAYRAFQAFWGCEGLKPTPTRVLKFEEEPVVPIYQVLPDPQTSFFPLVDTPTSEVLLYVYSCLFRTPGYTFRDTLSDVIFLTYKSHKRLA